MVVTVIHKGYRMVFASTRALFFFLASTSSHQIACEQLRKFCEHEQASTRVNFTSKSSEGHISRALENFKGPFNTPYMYRLLNKTLVVLLNKTPVVLLNKTPVVLLNKTPVVLLNKTYPGSTLKQNPGCSCWSSSYCACYVFRIGLTTDQPKEKQLTMASINKLG